MNGSKRLGPVSWRAVTKAGLAMAALFSFGLALGQVAFPQISVGLTSFAFEAKDWGTEVITSTKKSPYHAKTPTSIPGARVIKTLELKELLVVNKSVVVIDTLDGKNRLSIPGAFWMSGAGEGQFYMAENSRFSAALEKLTNGDKNRPIVFLCVSSECWLSYNASLHALEAGYKDVIWYRGGTNAWTGANFELKSAQSVAW